jgi:hypothetical protein
MNKNMNNHFSPPMPTDLPAIAAVLSPLATLSPLDLGIFGSSTLDE